MKQRSCANSHLSAKAHPFGRFIISGGKPGIDRSLALFLASAAQQIGIGYQLLRWGVNNNDDVAMEKGYGILNFWTHETMTETGCLQEVWSSFSPCHGLLVLCPHCESGASMRYSSAHFMYQPAALSASSYFPSIR